MAADGGSPRTQDLAPDRLGAWLSSLTSTTDVVCTARAIIERLVLLNRTPLDTRKKIQLLDMFRDHVDWLLPQLEGRLARAQPPLGGSLRQVAYCIEKLLKELGAGYTHVVLRAPRAWLIARRKRTLHAPLTRAMDLHARRLALSERLYTRRPRGVWAELHQLFQLARNWNIAELDIVTPHTSPLRVYREALLLAFAEPTKLMQGDFTRVQSYLTAHSDLAQIFSRMKVEHTPCVFAIDPSRDQPGVAYAKRSDAGFQNGALLLATHKLVERLETELRELADGAPPPMLGLPNEAARSHYQTLMHRLRKHWRGERKNRSARMRFHLRVDLWVGFRTIWRALRAETQHAASFADITQRDAPPRPAQWIILNESGRGFALRYLSGAVVPVTVGEIVALKTRDRSGIYVCLVRWVVSNNPDHLELGLQQLGPIVLPAVYNVSELDRNAPEPILFLPQVPAQKRAPAVAAPPNRVHANDALSLRHHRGRVSLCAARVIETTPSIELIEVVSPHVV